jgi:hypothetical protein
MKNTDKPYLSFLFAITLTGIIAGCGMQEIYSAWCGHKLTADGIDYCGELKNTRNLIAKGEAVVAVQNDDKMLFLHISTRNQAIQRQLFANGFTVWFDAEGGKKKIYGLHYPLGGNDSDRQQPLHRGRDKRNEKAEMTDKQHENMTGDIEIFGPGENEHSRMSVADSASHGIQCRLKKTGANLVYELRVPLMRNDSSPYGIALNKVKIIGIGLETGENSQMNVDVGVRGGGGGRGGSGGPGGGPGGGSGGMDRGAPAGGPGGESGGGPGGTGSMKPLNQWLKVHLTARP